MRNAHDDDDDDDNSDTDTDSENEKRGSLARKTAAISNMQVKAKRLKKKQIFVIVYIIALRRNIGSRCELQQWSRNTKAEGEKKKSQR